ncbi:DUF4384 domain-containing protein, partial [bacterium]|nr:DUF4384 domain-containing protein [bacterium]
QPTPPPSSILQEPETENILQPLPIAFRRYDAFASSPEQTANLDAARSKTMLEALQIMAGADSDISTIVQPTDAFGLLVVYGAQNAGRGVRYTAVVVDGNAQIVRSTAQDSLELVVKELRNEIERAWIATNLMRIRQPIGNNMRLSLSLRSDEEPRTRGMQVTRKRLRVGERVAFEITPSHDGYLTLLNIDSRGGVTLLYPNEQMQTNRSGFVKGGEILSLPGEGYSYPVQEPVGKECVKGFLTPNPLRGLAATLQEASAEGKTRPIAIMRGLGNELDRTIGVKATAPASPSESGKPTWDWSGFKSKNWAEAVLVFTTSE